MRSKHSLMMLICCLVPAGVLIALPLMGIGPSGLTFLGIILLCPLLHLLMMRKGHGHHQDGDSVSGFVQEETGNEQPASEGKRTK